MLSYQFAIASVTLRSLENAYFNGMDGKCRMASQWGESGRFSLVSAEKMIRITKNCNYTYRMIGIPENLYKNIISGAYHV